MKVQFTENEIKIMQTAYEQWGLNAQVGQAVEECAELIVALQKHVNRTPQPSKQAGHEASGQPGPHGRAGREASDQPETVKNIIDEIADVEMMLAQMRLILDIDDNTLRKRIEYKFERLSQYLLRDEV